MNNSERFAEIATELTDMYNRKNADYGDSFTEGIRDFGLVSAATRIADKYRRAVNLIRTETAQVKDERLEDTLLDLASYSIMTVMYLRAMRTEPYDTTYVTAYVPSETAR